MARRSRGSSPIPRWPSVAVLLACALVLLAGAAAAQSGGRGRLVAVDSFAQTGSSVSVAYGRFLTDLMRVRLTDEPGLTVGGRPRCATDVTPSTAMTDPHHGDSLDPDYVVSGRLDLQPDISRLEYRVVRCRAGRADSLRSGVRVIPRSQFYDEFTVTALLVARTIHDDVPRTRVTIQPLVIRGVPADTAVILGRTLVHDLMDAINESGDMVVSDSGDYVVRAEVEIGRGGAMTAHPRLALRRGGAGWPLPDVAGNREDFDGFSDRFLLGVVGWLSRLRSAGTLDAGAPSSIAALEDSAATALCLLGVAGCQVEVERALSIARAATQVDSTSASAWRLLGLAESARSEFGNAQRALSRSFGLLPADATAASRIDLLNTLARARFQLGDYKGALEDFDRSLSLDAAQPRVLMERAEGEWSLGHRLAALRGLLSLRPQAAGLADLDARILGHVTTLSADTIVVASGVVVDACGITDSTRTRCARWLHDVGMNLMSPDSFAERKSRAVFKIFLALQPSDPDARADALGIIAASYLGTEANDVARVGQRDYLFGRAVRFRPDSADAYLRRAEALATSAPLGPVKMEWLYRLRALYHRNRGDFAQAWVWARKAVAASPSDLATRVATDILYQWARRLEIDSAAANRPLADSTRKLYEAAARSLAEGVANGHDWAYEPLREVYHSLGRDRDAADLFEARRRQDSTDVVALGSLKYLYTEYLFDFPRAKSAAAARLALLSSSTTLDSLDLAEIELLAGQYDEAHSLLEVVGRRVSQPACEGMVAEFLRVWAEVGLGRRSQAGAREAFARWRSARERFAASPDERACWTFNGDRVQLAQSTLDPLLLQMIDAMTDRQEKTPAFQAER